MLMPSITNPVGVKSSQRSVVGGHGEPKPEVRNETAEWRGKSSQKAIAKTDNHNIQELSKQDHRIMIISPRGKANP